MVLIVRFAAACTAEPMHPVPFVLCSFVLKGCNACHYHVATSTHAVHIEYGMRHVHVSTKALVFHISRVCCRPSSLPPVQQGMTCKSELACGAKLGWQAAPTHTLLLATPSAAPRLNVRRFNIPIQQHFTWHV